MKFSINQNSFQEALTTVMKGISNRSTLPILSCIYIKAVDDSLILQSTDLELSIRYKVDALIEEPGGIVVSGKLLFEIIKSLPDAAIFLESEESSLQIVCDSSSFSLKTLQVQDFPDFPVVEVDKKVDIPFKLFSSMVKKVSRVVSRDETRPVLTGILITVEADMVKMVATDSYRLAIVDATLETPAKEDFEVVVSGSFLSDIASLPKSEQDISLAFSENQIVVTYQNIEFVNRRIEGTYPNYKQLLPSEYTTRVQVDVNNLSAAVKRTSLIGTTVSPVKFNLDKESQSFQISTMVQDVGAAQESLKCEIEGESMEIAFNFAYVIDGLNVITSDVIYFEAQDSMKPGVIKSTDSDNFLYLIMPVRLS